ncbi:MAG: histidine kinase [Spirosomaceae bacterium]|jgi:LytS/YehU family sensor histidine kinase|nr:histidine kinase [Spirosomataceae bacterium]
MKNISKYLPIILARACVIGTVIYFTYSFINVYFTEFSSPMSDIGGFIRYILGILFLLGLLFGLAFLNYRLMFLKIYSNQSDKIKSFYWAWVSGLSLIIFGLLQIRTEYDKEFIDENIILTATLITFIVIFSYVADYFRTQKQQIKLLKEKADAELNTLKAQIKPHFLFNSLNIIYGSAIKHNDEETAILISELSEILRFTTQESQNQFTDISKELSFIEKYISLQRARIPNNSRVKIDFLIDWDEESAVIAPLLLIPFIENAFQYAISLENESFIYGELRIEQKNLCLNIINSIALNSTVKKGTGVGIENARKRLGLLYDKKHLLNIQYDNKVFEVNLNINLS